MRIAVTGAGGFIGTPLTAALSRRGHDVVRLTRRPARDASEAQWDPLGGTVDVDALGDVDAVIHLAGESIVGRWTKAKKQRIHDSRVIGTRTLASALAGMQQPPRAFVSASAVGYYGDSGERELTETAPNGSGFLAEVVAGWEDGAAPLRDAGIRTVHLRTGIVLGAGGGALKPALLATKLGLGGSFGSGKQWMGWIGLHDLVRLYVHAVEDEAMDGVYNAVTPNPVRNRDYAKTLGAVVHRPVFMKIPAFALKLALGEMSQEVLVSQRVVPERLAHVDYSFEHPQLADALAFELGVQ